MLISRAGFALSEVTMTVEHPATIVRVYKGKQQGDAVRAMEPDAERLGAQGYYPTSQSWAQGQWGCGAFLVAVILMIVLVGILVFIYMLLVKPDGSLTVTYSLRVETPPPAPPEPPQQDIAVTLTHLAALRDGGLITAEEYNAKKAELLARM